VQDAFGTHGAPEIRPPRFVGSMQHVSPIAAGQCIVVSVTLHIGPVEPPESSPAVASVPESLLLLFELDPQPESDVAPAPASKPATPTKRNLEYFIG
jgi:hypothetical protein